MSDMFILFYIVLCFATKLKDWQPESCNAVTDVTSHSGWPWMLRGGIKGTQELTMSAVCFLTEDAVMPSPFRV